MKGGSNISYKLLRPTQFLGMVHFAEVNQAPPPTQCCSILAE